MNTLPNLVFLSGLFLLSTCLHATALNYNGKCQFTSSNERYAYCLEKEMVYYDNEFQRLYTRLTPEQSLVVTEVLSTEIIEPRCDALARGSGGGLEYQIVLRTCLINLTREKIACLKQVTGQNGIKGKLVHFLKAPYVFLEKLSIIESDPT